MPLRVALGVTLVGLGILGLFLPFLQGLLFITVGLAILAHDVPPVRRALDRLRRSRTAGRLRERLASLGRRWRG
ncbi:MAG: hypothetical protein FJ221_08405 [Lentisphaerae bacterium]|nr:hypothetical protein [Lentisphaerota bacterium]